MFNKTREYQLPLTKVVVVDVETQTIDARWNKELPVYCVCLLEVTDEGKSLTKYFSVEKAIARLQSLLDNGWLMVMHNAKFDLSVLSIRGLKHTIVPGELSIACTMVMAHTWDSTHDSYSLQALTGAKSDVIGAFVKEGVLEERVSEQSFWQTDWSNNQQALKLIASYCAQDLRATWGLYKALVAQYNREPKFINTLAYLEFPMLSVLSELEVSGSYVDKELLFNTIHELTKEKQACEQQIAQEAGLLPTLQWKGETYVPVVQKYNRKVTEVVAGAEQEFGLFKNKGNLLWHYVDNEGIVLPQWQGHLPGENDGHFVYDHCPLVPYNSAPATGHTWWLLKRYCPDVLTKAEKTKKGKPSLNKDYLKDVGDDIPDNLPISKLAKATKLLSMCEGISKHIQHDGRVHSSFQNTATRTTRLACVQPNLQQMPRVGTMVGEVDYGKKIRSLFAASDKHKILVADLNLAV